MTSRSNQLPADLLLRRSHGTLRGTRGQMPRPESANGEQAAVGKAFEEMLLREMVKALHKTIPQGSLMPDGPSKGLYEHMMQQAMVQNLAGQGGLGIAEALERTQNTLRRAPVDAHLRAAAAPMERATASNDRVEPSSSTLEPPELREQLPSQDDAWLDSPFAEAHLRRLLSDQSDRKNSPFPFKK